MVFESLAVHERKAADGSPVFNALEILESINHIGSSETASSELSRLLKRVDDHWESKDQKLFVDKIEMDEEAAKSVAREFNLLLDYNIGSKSPEQMLYRREDEQAKPETTCESKNENGESTNISASEHKVHVKRTDANGKEICTIDKTREKTTVESGKEKATKDENETVCSGKGCTIKVKRDGSKNISTDESIEIARDPDGNATIKEKDQATCRLEGQQLQVGEYCDHDVTFTTTRTDLSKATERIRARLRPDQIGLLVIKNTGNRLIFSNGTTIDIKDQQIRIRTKSGDVVSLEAKNGKFYIKDKDGDKELNKNNCPDCIKMKNGKFLIDGMELDTETFCLTGKRVAIDITKGRQTLESSTGEQTVACIGKDGCTRVQTKKRTISNTSHSDNVHLKNNETGNEIDINLATKKIESPIVTDTLDETVIRDSGTTVHKDGSVEFNGGHGPIIFADGSVQIDNKTYIGKNMDIISGDFRQAGHGHRRGELAAKMMDVNSITSSIYAKALAGTVKWPDISELNLCAGHLLSLMATLHSGCPAVAKIRGSLAQVLDALNFATNKISILGTDRDNTHVTI